MINTYGILWEQIKGGEEVFWFKKKGGKPKAAIFVDYEHWYYGYRNNFQMKPNIEEWLKELKIYLAENLDYVRTFLKEELPEIKLTEPEGTYLLWLDFKSLGMKEEQLKDLVENKAKLWLDSGAMFGPDGEGFERINIACPREILKQALTQLAESVHDR